MNEAQTKAPPLDVVLASMEKQLKAKEAAKVREYAQALVDKLHLIHENEQYKGVWFTAANHGVEYSGPKYDKELEQLERALGSGESAKQTPTDDKQPKAENSLSPSDVSTETGEEWKEKWKPYHGRSWKPPAKEDSAIAGTRTPQASSKILQKQAAFWIKTSERAPTEKDTRDGEVLVAFREWGFQSVNLRVFEKNDFAYWMSIPALPHSSCATSPGVGVEEIRLTAEAQPPSGLPSEETGDALPEDSLLDVLEFARGAIVDACFHEDGLNMRDGSAVIRMINGALLKNGRTPQPLDETYKRKPLPNSSRGSKPGVSVGAEGESRALADGRDTERLDWWISVTRYHRTVRVYECESTKGEKYWCCEMTSPYERFCGLTPRKAIDAARGLSTTEGKKI